jgi:hypothetical protein
VGHYLSLNSFLLFTYCKFWLRMQIHGTNRKMTGSRFAQLIVWRLQSDNQNEKTDRKWTSSSHLVFQPAWTKIQIDKRILRRIFNIRHPSSFRKKYMLNCIQSAKENITSINVTENFNWIKLFCLRHLV